MSGAADETNVRGKAARTRCGASVRKGQTSRPDPTERATAQRRGLCGVLGRQGGVGTLPNRPASRSRGGMSPLERFPQSHKQAI